MTISIQRLIGDALVSELDLEQFANSPMAVGQPKIWEQVLAPPSAGDLGDVVLRRLSDMPARHWSMSPSLLAKYLDAAKDIAAHAVLTPDGIHFSPSTTAFDRTAETLAKIREFYGRFSKSDGATAVNPQGIKFAD